MKSFFKIGHLFFSILISFYGCLAQASTDDISYLLSEISTQSQPVKTEILIAAGTTESLPSLFGHMALRVQLTTPKGQNIDLVLSMNADTKKDSNNEVLIKGAAPIYPIILKIESFKSYVLQTTIKEQRTIRRFLIPNDKLRVKNLAYFIKLHTQVPFNERYYFTGENCASMMYKLLGDMGYFINTHFQTKILPPLAPIHYMNVFLRPVLLGFIELPPISFPKEEVESISEKLNIIFSEDESRIISINTNSENIKKLNVFQINYLLNFSLMEFKSLRKSLINELRQRPDKTYLSDLQLLSFKEISSDAYELCKDQLCTDKVATSLLLFFGPKQTKYIYSIMRSETQRSLLLIYSEQLKKTDQYTHTFYLLKSLAKLLNIEK